MDAKGEFKFEKDGKTVQERLDEYERKLESYSSGITKELIRETKTEEEKLK